MLAVPARGLRGPADARFDSGYTVDPETGCWLWQRSRFGGSRSYGKFYADGRTMSAHKFAYERKYGPVPAGMQLDHYACDNPVCCNPDHVRPTSPRENVLRGDTIVAANLARKTCLRGHPFDEANTYVVRDGSRACRRCHADRQRSRQRSLRFSRS